MKYKAGYKYQTVEDELFQINICPQADIGTQFIDLSEAGLLKVKAGYAYDGPSGPTIDTKSFMRGALAHDALYQLMREKHLSSAANRKRADQVLRDVCLEDGMWKLRAKWVYLAVRKGAENSAKVGRPILEAP